MKIKRDAGWWKRTDVCCVMEGRWKMLKHFVLEYEEFDIDVGVWKGSRELWEQRSG